MSTDPHVVIDELVLERCRQTLAQALPGRSTDISRKERWPRLYLGEKLPAKYAYLVPVTDDHAEVHVFPGDTLEQAQILYEDAARADALLRLRERGWQAAPNFHFGFRETGYAWMTATAPVDRYVDYCLAYIGRAGTLARPAWDAFLDELERRGFASAGDRPRFREAFRNRNKAVPRPGLHLWVGIHASLDDHEDVVQEVRHRLDEILLALRIPASGGR